MLSKSEELFTELSTIQEVLKEITGFQEKTNKIQYSAKDLSIEPRFANQWKGKGLLFKEIVKGSTHNYSFLDCVWLKCIEKMRNFGIDFKIIHAFKNNLIYKLDKIDIEEYIKKGLMESLKIQSPNRTESEINEIFKNINPADFFVEINLLELAIYDMFLNKISYIFKIFENGELYFEKEGSLSGNDFENDTAQLINSSYFNLDLSEIIHSVYWEGIDFNFITNEKATALTIEEITILKKIRDPKVFKIELIFDKNKSDQIQLMHATEKERFFAEKRVSDYIFKNRYNKIIITAKGSDQVIVENTFTTKF
jgi:hypothetical protein